MKRIFLLAMLFCLSTWSYSQVTVNVLVTNTVPDTIKGARVYIYPDTSVPPPVFSIQTDTTDFLGNVTFVLPSLPLNTEFYVSTLDCDSVTFKVDTLIYTGNNNMGVNLVICVVTPDSLAGYVYLANDSKRPSPQQAMVYMIEKCAGNTVQYIDSVLTDTNGFYLIDDYPDIDPGCELLMHARLLPSSPEYEKYLPAYHDSGKYALMWLGGKQVSKAMAGRSYVNLILPEAINPTGGPSTIGGYAINTITGGVNPDKILMITDMLDIPVGYTYTDSRGVFSFGNLPFGSYKIFGDVWQKDNPPLTVSVHADHVNEYDIIFTENMIEFKGRIATGVTAENALSNIRLYPNPVTDYIYLHGTNAVAGSKTITLSGVAGNLIHQMQFAHGEQVVVPANHIAPGIYLLKLYTEAGSSTFRVIK